jgi:hypothetical protein
MPEVLIDRLLGQLNDTCNNSDRVRCLDSSETYYFFSIVSQSLSLVLLLRDIVLNFISDMILESTVASPFAVASVFVALSFALYRLLQVGKRDPRMPPGPPTIPILGNLHQVPITGLYKQYVPCGYIYMSAGIDIFVFAGFVNGRRSMVRCTPSNSARPLW